LKNNIGLKCKRKETGYRYTHNVPSDLTSCSLIRLLYFVSISPLRV